MFYKITEDDVIDYIKAYKKVNVNLILSKLPDYDIKTKKRLRWLLSNMRIRKLIKFVSK